MGLHRPDLPRRGRPRFLAGQSPSLPHSRVAACPERKLTFGLVYDPAGRLDAGRGRHGRERDPLCRLQPVPGLSPAHVPPSPLLLRLAGRPPADVDPADRDRRRARRSRRFVRPDPRRARQVQDAGVQHRDRDDHRRRRRRRRRSSAPRGIHIRHRQRRGHRRHRRGPERLDARLRRGRDPATGRDRLYAADPARVRPAGALARADGDVDP